MTRLWQKIAAQRNRRYQGKVLDALVTEQGQNGTMKARAKNYLGIVVNGRTKMGSLVKVIDDEFESVLRLRPLGARIICDNVL